MIIVWVLAGWLAASVAFGALWVLLATALKAARRRLPHDAVVLAAAAPARPARPARCRVSRASRLGAGRLAGAA